MNTIHPGGVLSFCAYSCKDFYLTEGKFERDY